MGEAGGIAVLTEVHSGANEAIGVLAGAMRFMESPGELDRCLLSSIPNGPHFPFK